jgi:surface protein
VDSSKTLLDSFTDFYGVSFGSADNVPWYSMRSYIQTVSFAASFAPTSMAYWFSDAGNLAYFNSANLDTSSTTSMAHMFSGCNRLQELDMSSWNTGSVTDMSYMFSGCFGLKELDVSVLNTQSVQNMSGMFQYCTGLSSLDVGGWNVSSVSNMSYLFAGLNIESLHLTNWNTASLTDTSGMFQYDGNLVSIYVGDDWTSENIRSSSNMFGGCSSLSGSAGTKYDAMHTDKLYARIDKDSAPGYFSGNTVFAVLYTDGSLVFQYGNDPMKGKTIEAAYSDIASHGWSAYMEKIVSVAFQVPVAPTTMEGWFNGAKNLTSIDFTNLDTSNVASMNDTFAGCSSLTAINLSGLDTSNVQTMEGMFMGCSKLTSISGLDFDTSKVTVFASMFQDCPALTSLDLSAFDSSRVTNMSAMFSGDEALSGIYVSSRWSTASVTDSAGMFSGCTSLVGGSGTSYTEDHTDADYAKIDGSISDPGYFSGKSAPSKVSKIRLTYSTENNEVMGYTENT